MYIYILYDINLSIYLSIYRLIDLSVYLSICLSFCLSIYLSVYLSLYTLYTNIKLRYWLRYFNVFPNITRTWFWYEWLLTLIKHSLTYFIWVWTTDPNWASDSSSHLKNVCWPQDVATGRQHGVTGNDRRRNNSIIFHQHLPYLVAHPT